MNDDDLLRYSRQIMLSELDIEGQQKLRDAHALIIGLGGLGSPVSMYLTAAGLGQLTLVDDDQVDMTNLQRQIVHDSSTVGQDKVASAKAHLARLNNDVVVHTINRRLSNDELDQKIAEVDIVIDCCDNFDTRFAVNRSCHAHQTPLVSGAAIRWEGQISVFHSQPDQACYHCLYGEGVEAPMRCSENGVISPLVGIIGSIQALEAIKVIAGCGESLQGQLQVFDGLYHQWRSLKLVKDPKCPVCGNP